MSRRRGSGRMLLTGSRLCFPSFRRRLDAVVERLVVPELQRRGIVRREYEGTTLREHLGLPRPQNQFFS